jgi:putative Mg2+ transporter-C (MgtC) family protein
MLPEYEHIIQILASLAAGAILELEREYHSKPAGLRILILISVSSYFFSILSTTMQSGDRIASNIITGIGFIGAGVVFKEGATV